MTKQEADQIAELTREIATITKMVTEIITERDRLRGLVLALEAKVRELEDAKP